MTTKKIIIYASIIFILGPTLIAGLTLFAFGFYYQCQAQKSFYCPAVNVAAMSVAVTHEAWSKASDFIFPDVEVLVKDDVGNTRVALLKDDIALSRSVNKGDEVRLNCLHASEFQNKKLCELEFSGFDINSTSYPRDSNLYGKYPSYAVPVDDKGVPDKNILTFR